MATASLSLSLAGMTLEYVLQSYVLNTYKYNKYISDSNHIYYVYNDIYV